MTKIFAQPQNIIIPSSTIAKSQLVSVTIGKNSAAKQYRLINQAGGRQPFRTQYDIALDGTQYVLAAGRGLGDYEFTMLDNITDCSTPNRDANITSNPSFIPEYKNMRTAQDRWLRIVTGADNSGNGRNTLIFKGLVNMVTATAARGDNGEAYLQINLSAVGIWS